MIVFSPQLLHKYFRFPQHVDDLLCCESFSWQECLPHHYSNSFSLTFKVDPFSGGRSGWSMLFYSAGAGFFLALRSKKTSMQKITALCGTGLVVMMWIVAK